MVARSDIQYTVRGVPPTVDRALRQMAEEKYPSLNTAILELLSKELEAPKATLNHDLDQFIGTWVHDPETDEALKSQRQIFPGDWT